MPFGMGPLELGIIAAIIVLLFGASKIPELARGLGQGIKEFRRSVDEISEEPKELKDGVDKPQNIS